MKTEREKAVVGTAIPVATALSSFSDPRYALLAVLVFGLTVGQARPSVAQLLADAGDEILREDHAVGNEYDQFLRITELMTGLLLID